MFMNMFFSPPPLFFFFGEHKLPLLLDKCLKVQLLDQMAAAYFIFLEAVKMFAWIVVPLCVPTSDV